MEATQSSETRLVRNTAFEKVLADIKGIKDKELEEARKKEPVVQGYRQIFLSIISAYFYLRHEHDMPRIDLSLESFEATHGHLKKIAQSKIVGPLLKFVGIKTGWQYFLDNGHFRLGKTPFGRWWLKHPIFELSFNPHVYVENYEYYKTLRQDQSYSVPPNVTNLMKEVYGKRYGSEQNQGGK